MRVLGAVALAAGLAGSAPALAAPPPASAFGRLPLVQEAAISPDGRHVAILGGPADDRRISMATIDQPGLPALRMGDLETEGIAWANNDYLIASTASWYETSPRHEYRIQRNLTIDTQARAHVRLLDGIPGIGAMTAQPIIGFVDGPEPKALIDGGSVLWRADVATGRGTVEETGLPKTTGWDVDLSGEARVRLDIDNKTLWVMGRPKGQKTWKVMWQGPYRNAPDVYYGYSDPEDAIYLYKEDASGVGRVVRKRLSDGSETTIASDVKDSAFQPVWDENLRTVVGFRRTGERDVIEWTDPAIAAVQVSLQKLFGQAEVKLENWSKDRSRFVVLVSSPSLPETWYLFDHARKELSPLGEGYPELKGAAFGSTRWITYKARDGLEIGAYVTMPPGPPTSGKRPLVVLPHGGPAARDGYGFDYIRQFLATRGYVVLQPQFRGSWGFGKAFEDAGKGEWGGKMQTDLLDGIAALAATGAIDPQRVCIVGASFGGYAAMAGAAFHSDSYRCAASLAGISDLGKLVIEAGRLYGPESAATNDLRHDLGNDSTAKLIAMSPAQHADSVRIPLLLIHGDKDTVVPIEQSEEMVEAMKRAGKPVQLVVLEGENHYLTKTATRTQFLEALDGFLAKNLPTTP